jgi:hypothetical protein
MSSGGSSASSSSSSSTAAFAAASTASRNNTNAQPQVRFPPTWPQLDGSFLADVPPVRSLREWMRTPLRNEAGQSVKVCFHLTTSSASDDSMSSLVSSYLFADCLRGQPQQ